MKRRRAIVEILSAVRESESRPRVTLSRLADNSVSYSVTATGPTAKRAATQAMETFRELAQFAILMKDRESDDARQKLLDRMKRKPPELAHK